MLGGIYNLNKAPHGKDGSPLDALCVAKLKIALQDGRRCANRFGILAEFPANHPAKSLYGK